MWHSILIHTHPLSEILVIHNPRRRDPSLTNRLSGRVVVLIKDTLAKSVQPLLPHPEDSIWLKINGLAVGLDHDIAIGVVYVPPNAPKESDPFGPLRQGMERVPVDMPCYILRDLNARTGDYYPSPDITPFVHVEGIQEEEMEVEFAPRHRLQYRGRNPYGRELIQLADISDMVILNPSAPLPSM